MEETIEEIKTDQMPLIENFQPAAAAPQPPQQTESDKKIDKAADIFVATTITIIQLLFVAVLVCFGLSATPAVSFTAWSVVKTFCLLLGVKFVVAGYSTKKF